MTIAYKAKKKGAQNERLNNHWCYMLIVGNHHLLADAENVLYHFWLVINWYLIYYVFMKYFGGQTGDKNLLSKR